MSFSITSPFSREKKRSVTAFIVLLCALLGATGVSATAAEPAASASTAHDAEDLLLAVSVNGQAPTDVTLVVRVADPAGLLVRREDLLRWRMLVPAAQAVSRDGESFYRLDALAGLSYRVDEPSQTLLIEAPAALFAATRVAGPHGVMTAPTPSPLGGFLNYDVFGASDPGRTSVNALGEVGVFNAWGIGVSDFLRKDLPDGARVLRLSTTWTQDRPEQMASLRLGDLISASGSWGRSVRFGGVQWATNFASQPGFITYPRPTMAGEAVLPSTIDLYVGDALRMRRQVPAGPFSIQDLPVMTGQGEARLVVTDLLGREQVIVAPYYASPRLLQKGLNAYSFEIGAIREDFGRASNHYGRPLAVGTFRRGFTGQFTAEAHAELLETQQTAGFGGAFLWPVGVFSASVAASRSDPVMGIDSTGTATNIAGGSGGQISGGFQGQYGRLGYGANVQLASAGFAQVGSEPGVPAPRESSQAFVSYGMHRAGSFAVSYTRQDRRDADDVDLVNASYSVTLGRFGFMSLSALRILGSQPASIVSLNFTRMITDRDTGSVTTTKDADSTQASVRVQRSLPPGNGMGYRLGTGMSDSDRREAAIAFQNDVGTYGAEVGQLQGEMSYRVSASGGIAMLGTDAFLSRRIENSFAVVRVPGYADVNVYRDNQPIARTNEHGVALVSRLRPYEVNSVRIEQADLPLDAQIGALQLDAIPYLRSGVVVSFPVKRSRGAVFNLMLDDGAAVPAGAVVKIVGQPEEFPVGLRGEVYVVGLESTNRLEVSWRGQRCGVDVPFPESSDPLPDLGTFKCGGVVR